MSAPHAAGNGTLPPAVAPGWSAPSSTCGGFALGSPGPLDAYLPWDTLTGSARHLAQEEATRTQRSHEAAGHWPVMVEFAGGSGMAAASLDAWCRDATAASHAEADNWGHAFAASIAAAPGSALHSAILPHASLSMLLDGVANGYLVRFQVGAPCVYAGAPPSWPAAVSSPLAGFAGAHTLGIIDDGCCFAHQHFRTADGASRVHALWDQTPAAVPEQGWSALSALGHDLPYPYGVELLKPDLDRLLARHPGYGEAAERALYESIGRGGWGRGGHTHGARVMHLAVPEHDWTKRVSAAANAARPIVFVQLPWQTVRDVTGDSLGMHVVDGARYIVARARELAGGSDDWRATINISLGSIGGPHDGTSMAEQALADLVAQHADKLTLVMAAGNTAGPRQRIHAQHAVSADAPGQFLLRLPPGHRRDCFVELWFDSAAVDAAAGAEPNGLAIQVTTPDGRSSSLIGLGQATQLTNASGQPCAALVFPRRSAQGTKGTLALLAIAATLATPRVPRALAEPGIWRVTVSQRHPGAATAVVHAWVERDDSVTGRRTGQQARFQSLSSTDASVNDDMTLSNLANADDVVAVGGYVESPNRVAAYSANGPRRGEVGPALGKPGFYAVSDRSQWLPGVAVPGFYSGSHATINGTSAAAPQMARALMDETELKPAQLTGPLPRGMTPPPELRPARVDGRPFDEGRLPSGALVLREKRSR